MNSKFVQGKKPYGRQSDPHSLCGSRGLPGEQPTVTRRVNVEAIVTDVAAGVVVALGADERIKVLLSD